MYNIFSNDSGYLSSNNEITVMSVSEMAEYLGIGKNKAYDLLKKAVSKDFVLAAHGKSVKLPLTSISFSNLVYSDSSADQTHFYTPLPSHLSLKSSPL